MWKTKFQFQLDISQRTKLIEILLIVGSIVAAFKIPTKMLWLFMLFVLLSILYYILIQKEKDFSKLLDVTSIFVSASFVGIVIYNFAISLISMLEDFVITFGFAPGVVVLGVVLGVLISIYYVFFTFIIYKALRPSN
jgi:hypothetical protein